MTAVSVLRGAGSNRCSTTAGVVEGAVEFLSAPRNVSGRGTDKHSLPSEQPQGPRRTHMEPLLVAATDKPEAQVLLPWGATAVSAVAFALLPTAAAAALLPPVALAVAVLFVPLTCACASLPGPSAVAVAWSLFPVTSAVALPPWLAVALTMLPELEGLLEPLEFLSPLCTVAREVLPFWESAVTMLLIPDPLPST